MTIKYFESVYLKQLCLSNLFLSQCLLIFLIYLQCISVSKKSHPSRKICSHICTFSILLFPWIFLKCLKVSKVCSARQLKLFYSHYDVIKRHFNFLQIRNFFKLATSLIYTYYHCYPYQTYTLGRFFFLVVFDQLFSFSNFL